MRRAQQSAPAGHLQPPGASERGLAVRGDAAASWLLQRGVVVSECVGVLQLFADEIAVEGFVVRRMWFTGARFDQQSRVLTARDVVATFVVEGEGEFGGTHDRADAGRGALMLRSRSDAGFIRCTGPMAIIQVESDWIRLSPDGPRGTVRLELSDAFAQIFVSIVTATLNSSIEPADRGFASVCRSIEFALAAALSHHRPRIEYQGSSFAKRRLYEQATALIGTRFSDPSLTVAAIATELSVSKAYLQRAFKDAGISPMQYLRRVRAINARAAIQAQGATRPAHLAMIAKQNGFSSASTMRAVVARALRPQPGGDADDGAGLGE
jgi:AraC-like DNA-binding protein